jgi:hypothetical protein
MLVRGQLTWSITRGSPRTWGSSHVLGIASAILQLACSKGGRRFPRETSGTVGIQSSHVEAKNPRCFPTMCCFSGHCSRSVMMRSSLRQQAHVRFGRGDPVEKFQHGLRVRIAQPKRCRQSLPWSVTCPQGSPRRLPASHAPSRPAAMPKWPRSRPGAAQGWHRRMGKGMPNARLGCPRRCTGRGGSATARAGRTGPRSAGAGSASTLRRTARKAAHAAGSTRPGTPTWDASPRRCTAGMASLAAGGARPVHSCAGS